MFSFRRFTRTPERACAPRPVNVFRKHRRNPYRTKWIFGFLFLHRKSGRRCKNRSHAIARPPPSFHSYTPRRPPRCRGRDKTSPEPFNRHRAPSPGSVLIKIPSDTRTHSRSSMCACACVRVCAHLCLCVRVWPTGTSVRVGVRVHYAFACTFLYTRLLSIICA